MTFVDACEFVTKHQRLSPEDLVRAAFAEGEKQGHKLPLRELHKWREVFGHLGTTPDECGNVVYNKNGEYEARIDRLEAALKVCHDEADHMLGTSGSMLDEVVSVNCAQIKLQCSEALYKEKT